MNDLPEGFDSVFRHIVVVSQRAEQLLSGAKPRLESKHTKLTLIAEEEVAQGLVDWRILTAAELEAQRQAMVEQLRAEMEGAEGAGAERAVPDVLPTAAAAATPEAAPAEEGHDDELARLQKLLGMAGVVVAEEAGDEAKAKAKAETEVEAEVEAEAEASEDVVDLEEGEEVISLDELALEEEAKAGDGDDKTEEG